MLQVKLKNLMILCLKDKLSKEKTYFREAVHYAAKVFQFLTLCTSNHSFFKLFAIEINIGYSNHKIYKNMLKAMHNITLQSKIISKKRKFNFAFLLSWKFSEQNNEISRPETRFEGRISQ